MSRENHMLRMEAHHNETVQSFVMYMDWNRWTVLVWYLPNLQESLSIVFYYIGVTLNNRLPLPPPFAPPAHRVTRLS